MTDLQKRLFAAFDSEYRAILESIRTAIFAAEGGGAPLSGAALNEAFRMAHTLKGSAHVVGFASIVTLAHRLESLFATVREGQLRLGVSEFRAIHAALGAVEDVVAASRSGASAPDALAAIGGLEAILGLPSKAATPAAAPEKPKLVAVSAAAARAAPESESVRLNSHHLDRLLGTAGELLSAIRGERQIDAQLAGVGSHLDAVAREWDLLRRSSSGALQKMSQAPEFARVAQFLDLVGAELLPLSKQIRAARAASQQNEWDLRMLSEQLQDDVRQARIVPAESVFGGFHKMVRDLAADLDRGVDFRLSGLEVEADRAVLQALKDPLMHMLRNAVGHGLEAKDARASLGKDPTGKISVRISATGGRLSVIVEDDGQGLNEAKIRARAIEMGLASKDEAEKMDADAIAELIFAPGFSTASEVSDISGRGMGMSVVSETVKRLQGQIHVRSAAGRSLAFSISVPIALANHRLALAQYGGQTYAFPCRGVESLRRIKKDELKTVDGRLSILVNGAPTALVSLGAAIGMADAGVANADETIAVAVVRSGGRYLAVAVDSITEECEAIIKDLGAPLRKQNVFSGAVLQGDGALALVLEPRALIENAAARIGRGARPSTQKTPAPNKRSASLRILVVDDSITTRTLEKGILESNGHRVSLAVDGLDALARLQVEPFDLVISDVEMPRMDGVALVAEIKKHPKLAKIPVIMVTSRDRPEDRARGLSAGANAYVSKQKFDQGDLLETIKRVA